MPPRTRKKSTPASTKAKKSTPKSRKLEIESSPVDQNDIELVIKGEELEATEHTGNKQEGVSAAAKDGEAERAAVDQIKQEFRFLGPNSTSEAKVKEEIGEEEGDAEVVMEDGINVKIESFIECSGDAKEGGKRIEGVQSEKNDNGYVVEVTEKSDDAAEENLAADGRNERTDGDNGGTQLAIVPGEEKGDAESVMEDGINVKIESFIESSGDAEEGGERIEGVQSEKNDNGYVAEVTEKSDNAAEENLAADGRNERMDGDNGGTQVAIVPVAEQNLCDEGTAAGQIGDAKALGDNNNVLVLCEGGNGRGVEVAGMDDTGDSEEADRVDNEDEENPSLFFDNHITERKEEKDLEIFIGRLDKGVVEDDLIEVFGKFGEIKSVRLVRNPTTNQSRGFAFIQYATVEQAKNALSALKDGIQVGGKRVKMSASQDNDTLYMGNICKLWTKERVLETLRSYGIENIEEIHLPNDPQKGGKIRGFALLEFSTHSDALAAFQRLRKPDAVFGRDISAKVAFAQTPMHPNEEILSQVKTVYVEGLTDAWNEGKLKEICRQYGEVVNIKLSRNLGTKRKDYGFVTFTSRESTLACIEGINNACIGEGDVKVKASIAKPHVKGRLQKQGTRGGYKVTGAKEVPLTKEESERENKAVSPKSKGHAKSEKAKKKAKMVAGEKGKALFEPEIVDGGKPNKHQTVREDQFVQPLIKLGKKKRKNENLHSKVEGREETRAKQGRNEMQSKRQMGTSGKRGRQSNSSRKPKRDPHIRKGSNYGADSFKYRNPREPGYGASSVSYQSHAYATTISGSKRPYTDMEPHAGYLEPVARKQGRRSFGYIEPPVGIPPVRMQYQPLMGYQESAVVTQSRPQTGYHEPPVVQYSIPRAGYLAPAVGTYGQPHTGYLEPAVGRQSRSHAVYAESSVPNYSHDPYMRRAGRQDLHASGHSAYGSGSSLPSSYVPSYTNYVGYEGGSSVSGGAHLVHRAYY